MSPNDIIVNSDDNDLKEENKLNKEDTRNSIQKDNKIVNDTTTVVNTDSAKKQGIKGIQDIDRDEKKKSNQSCC